MQQLAREFPVRPKKETSLKDREKRVAVQREREKMREKERKRGRREEKRILPGKILSNGARAREGRGYFQHRDLIGLSRAPL